MKKLIDIYRLVDNVETLIYSVSNENSTSYKSIMDKDKVTVEIVTEDPTYLQEGDYIYQDSIKYKINRDPEDKQKSDKEHSYTISFEAPIYTLIDKYYCSRITGDTTITLTGKLRDFLELLIWNINKDNNPLGVDTGWAIGVCPDTDYMNITLTGVKCRDVLDTLSSKFGFEYYVNNKTVNYVSHIENETGLVFTQGKGGGLYEIERKNVDDGDLVTRVYAKGGTDNVIPGEGDSEGRLVLPEKYIENFSESNRGVEAVVEFDNIYPTFQGAIETVSGDNNREFICSGIDFNVSDLIIDDTARVNFLTGDLLGKSFEFKWNNTEKKITLIYQEDTLASIDSSTGTRPNIPSTSKYLRGGELFNFTGIKLSGTYKTNAITKLRQKATEWLAYYCRKRVKFELEVDYRYLRENNIALNCGDLITINIPLHNINKLIRITSIEKNLYTGKLTCIVSNYLDEKWKDKIETEVANIKSSTTTVNGGIGGASSVTILEKNDDREASDLNVFSSLRALKEIADMALLKKEAGTAEELIAFLKGIKLGDKLLLDIIRSADTSLESDTNVYSAAKSIAKFLKKEGDTATGILHFLKGLDIPGLASISEQGDATFQNISVLIKAVIADLEVSNSTKTKELTVTDTATTINLIVQQLAKSYDLEVDHVATLFRTIVKDYVSSETFLPGFEGSGMKLYKALNGDWNLEIDNVVVRKAMTIFELVIQKIRSINGALAISQANGKIKAVTSDDTHYILEIEGSDMPFVAHDLLRYQTFSGTSLKSYWVEVESVSELTVSILKTEFITALPAVSDELVQMGNTQNTARQSLIYLSAAEDGKPRISILSGINSKSFAGKLKTRLGNLDDITDTDFPADAQPGDDGMYSINCFLKGIFVLRNGKTVDAELDGVKTSITSIQTTLTVLDGRITASVTETKSYADSVAIVAKQDAISDAATKYTTKTDFNAQVEILSTQITSKVSQTDFNSLGQRVASSETTILQQAGQISLKADQSSVDSLTTRIASAELKLLPDSIIGTVSSTIDNKINAVQIGGRNLLLNSNDFSKWSLNSSVSSITATGNLKIIDNYYNNQYGYNNISIDSDGYYTISFTCLEATSNSIKYEFKMIGSGAGKGSNSVTLGKNVLTCYIPAGIYYGISFYGTATGSNYVIIKNDLKLEKGNKATDWTRAEEDIEADAQAKANTAESNSKGYADSTFTTKSDFTAQVTILSNQISLKVAQTDFNALGQRVSSTETNITSLSGEMSLKASRSDFNALSDRVVAAEIKITPDAIKSTVQGNIDSAVNAVQIGGRNLLFHTALTYNSSITGNSFSSTTGDFLKVFTRDGAGLLLVKNQQYVLSFNYVISNYVDGIGCGIGSGLNIGGYDSDTFAGVASFAGASGKFVFRFTYSADDVRYFAFRPLRITSGNTGTINIAISNLKLEKGNKQTDWTPAPEDVQGQIDSAVTRIVNAETSITQQAGLIALKANQTDVSDLQARMVSAEIKITPAAIISTVQSTVDSAKNDAISQAASDATNKVNAVKVGGRNIIFIPTRWQGLGGFVWNSINQSILEDQENYYSYTESNQIQLEVGYSYVLSFYCLQLSGTFMVELQSRPDNSNCLTWIKQGVSLGYNEIKFTCNQQLPTGFTHYTLRFFGNDSSKSILCEINKIKLEKGNKATDWTPAPEDVDYNISSKTGYPVRYIRDWLNGSISNIKNHWVELKAFQGLNNVALNKLSTLKSSGSTTYIFTDGDITATNYCGNTSGLDAFTIDLGQIYQDVDYLQIWHYYADGRTYYNTKTEVSADGITWYTLFDSAVSGTYQETSVGHRVNVSFLNISQEDAAKKYTTLTTYNSKMQQLDSAISAKVESSTFNALGDRVSAAEGNISVMSTQISSKVSTTDFTGTTIASLINQTATSIKIQANKIALEGLTTINSNFKVLEDGSIVADNATFTGIVKATSGNIGNLAIDNGDVVGMASGVEKIRISTGAITSLASIVNGDWQQLYTGDNLYSHGTTTERVNFDSTSGMISSKTVRYQLPDRAISLSAQSSIKLSGASFGIQDDYIDTYCSNKTYHVEIWNSANTSQISSSTDLNNIFYNIAAGNYILKVYVDVYYGGEVDISRYSAGASFSLFGIGLAYTSIQYLASITRTMIGNNGIYSMFSITNYMYYSKDDGFETKVGTAGIKITSSRVTKMVGGTWKGLNDKTTYYLTTTAALYLDNYNADIDYVLSDCASTTSTYLPANPCDGKQVYVRKKNSGNANIYGNGHYIYSDSVVSSKTVTNNCVGYLTYVSAIGYWMWNYSDI